MYTPDLGGGLGADIDHTGTTSAVLDLADLGGSIATTLTLPASGNAESVNAYASYDEYGNPETGAVTTGANSYGWLGTKQRAAAGAGLTLMGARLYNPTTGRFTSTDPVPGGNENAYVYPNDPVNLSDCTGDWGWLDTFDAAAAVLGAASFVCPVCGVASAAISLGTGIYRISHGDNSGWLDIAGAATFGVAKGLEVGLKTVGKVAMKSALKAARGNTKLRAVARATVKAKKAKFRANVIEPARAVDKAMTVYSTVKYAHETYKRIESKLG